MSKPPLLAEEATAFRIKLAELVQASNSQSLPAARRRAFDSLARGLIADLEDALSKIDPVAMPTSVFDPSNPKIVGRFTALAMVAQTRHPLESVRRFYGSGVYAIYYTGDYPLYLPLAGTESPIYVGKAGPATGSARTAREQGERLAARLNDHRKSIGKANSTLKIGDFQVRYIVVQSGWETAAEDYLIHLFQPIWNSEVDILYGLGKHGDDPLVRANKRSPWDTLHPGRRWAEATKEDARSVDRISADLNAHFGAYPVYRDMPQLFEAFISELRQH